LKSCPSVSKHNQLEEHTLEDRPISEDDFVLVESNEIDSCDSPQLPLSSPRPSSITITGFLGFHPNASPPAPSTPFSVASTTDWNTLPTIEQRYSKRKKSGFTGHSRVMFSAGGREGETSGESLDRLHVASTVDQQLLSRSPWHWSCPIPRLRILLMAVGTRGDVQPFALLGMKLLQDGHRVRLATHECYRQYVQSFGGGGLEFFPLGGDPIKLSEFMVKTHGSILPTSTEFIKQVPFYFFPTLFRLYSHVNSLPVKVPENLMMLNEIINSCWPACVETDPLSSDQRCLSRFSFPRSSVFLRAGSSWLMPSSRIRSPMATSIVLKP
jgi:hypothetical protein